MVYNSISEKARNGKKQFALLIDPDNCGLKDLEDLTKKSESNVDFFLVGGSLLMKQNFAETIVFLKSNSNIPVIIFPGNDYQVHSSADAILFLSLVSGRNPELLIGRHVLAAPVIKNHSIEPISTGYILVDGGNNSSVRYMSNSNPVPREKPAIAASTALAAEMLGMKLVYLEAGSGAALPIPEEMVKMVREYISVPLITGGGIKNPETALGLCKAGSDIIVMGNAIEKSPSLIKEVSSAIHGR